MASNSKHQGKRITCYQELAQKKQPPFEVVILDEVLTHWIVGFTNDDGENQQARVHKGACTTLNP